ncbi:cupin domain-containing protein [Herbaspirillum sp. alder98]|uniref:cupin domain-containing protein n=1 Tax=Herbaspirillum sp. alder98 TaxID=2913096 RepID=UPI001CD83595|nr:cupin domain-containing protein [Herbaspirillum sp. alder98]MCA1326455.1 cupin domain-containing protein [Herbaspirillum sp. alder98]
MQDKPSDPTELITRLALLPHPEGGHFRETFRSQQTVARSGDGANRSASTAIYYLLRSGERSTWHRIKSDEVWHFYDGSPLHVHVLQQNGELGVLRLGNPLLHEGATFQAVVPAGAWFAAECADPHTHSLVGCTVAPGFEFAEFEIADRHILLQTWPQHAAIIERLA